MKFDYWMQWGTGLSDAQFAAAWLALGIVAGTARKAPASQGYLGLIERHPDAASADTLLEIARHAVGDALSAAREHALSVTWRFPEPTDTVDADGRLPLVRIDPAAWAQAWVNVAGIMGVQPRLRIVNTPPGEPHLPWLRLLGEARPAAAAVSMAWSAPNPILVLNWPLRLGAVSADGEAAIAAALGKWPSERLARHVNIDRDNANCDVLVHSGTMATLLAALLALPFRCKANLVLIASASDAGTESIDAQLQAVAQHTSASGIVLWTLEADPAASGAALNTFVEEFSHDKPLDQALHAAAQHQPVGTASTWLTDAIAAVRMRSLADTLVARVQALPAGTAIDVEKLSPHWVKQVTRFTARTGARATTMRAGYTDADTVQFDTSQLHFGGEREGASELATLGAAVADARTTEDTDTRRAARFLQQQSFVRRRSRFSTAAGGFVAGKPALVRVRIGPAEEKWQSTPSEFPANALPPGHQQWRLTVWLIEPGQLPEPLHKSIILPVDGPSSECEFRFTPKATGPFDGRITVLHRGRVLQTAALRGGVVAVDAPQDPGAAPVLLDLVPVRHRLGDLEGRRQFDLAFVTNHTEAGEPRGVALSADHAWIADVSKSLAVTADINTALSRVAKSVTDYADGLAGEKGRALFVDLAKKGAWLDLYLVRQQIDRPTNRPDVARQEYIQIVSTRTDATVPFEFIYDHEVPDDDAAVCAHWRDALTQGSCPQQCSGGDARRVCPLGFWGLRKVIERHQVTPELAAPGREFFLQSEPGRDSADLPLGGTALFASSKRVPGAAQDTVTTTLKEKLGAAPVTATTWGDWATMVAQAKPHFLLALPHTDGTGANVTLEIGGTTIGTIQVKKAHVHPANEPARPLVALLGCDTAGTANEYAEHVAVFRDRGAAVVIGTIATVFGEHAARVGVLLAQELLPNGAAPQRLGEAMRALKQRALLEGLLMPLCVVAYGDADWRLVR
ncbi:hypothetical protein [Alicycliphilus denitrificans]|uniref:hypothetical protein n=1 Tax=Alicycliphilus denitrificans TaxID=179636 RepID=UPI003850C68A